MKKVMIKIEDDKEFEIKIPDKDLETLIKIIKVFDINVSGKIKK